MNKYVLTALFLLLMAPFSFGSNIKEPNVSGQFYFDDPSKLSAHVEALLRSAKTSPSDKKIEMIISPHAAHVYSGGVAAYGFKQVSQKSFKTIVVIAPSHYYGFDGVSIWEEGAFRTPLGLIDVDKDFAKKLIRMHERFIFDEKAFDREHSLEVQLPFLQETFTGYKIVPIVMGQASMGLCEKLAESLNALISDRKDVLVVISTDLSHFHDDVFARKMDRRTITAVKDLQAENVWKQCMVGTMEMCGYVPVTTALYLAKLRGLKADILSYANSGDVGGDKNSVVGYTSLVFYPAVENEKTSGNVKAVEGAGALTLEQKRQLIEIARKTVHDYVTTGKTADIKSSDPRLNAAEGAFVTINKHGRLRGCIGNIVTSVPLVETVQSMAVAAASADPRFKPVTDSELKDIEIEISVLSKPRTVKDVNEIEVGKHGVIVQQGRFHKGVFLPQVATEWGWNREEFLSNLCSHKAGLPADAWKDPETQIEIFTADVFSEEDVKE